MTIKERIQAEAKLEFCDSYSENVFKAGADFAIKAVIEMLEERSYHWGEMGYSIKQDVCIEIINLLKSES